MQRNWQHLGTQGTGLRQTIHNTETLNDEQHGPHQKPGLNPSTREGLPVPASYKSPSRFLIIVQRWWTPLYQKKTQII